MHRRKLIETLDRPRNSIHAKPYLCFIFNDYDFMHFPGRVRPRGHPLDPDRLLQQRHRLRTDGVKEAAGHHGGAGRRVCITGLL